MPVITISLELEDAEKLNNLKKYYRIKQTTTFIRFLIKQQHDQLKND